MDDTPRAPLSSWALLVTCVAVLLMGVFILTSTSDPEKGGVFVVFGGAWIAFLAVRAVVALVRRPRD